MLVWPLAGLGFDAGWRRVNWPPVLRRTAGALALAAATALMLDGDKAERQGAMSIAQTLGLCMSVSVISLKDGVNPINSRPKTFTISWGRPTREDVRCADRTDDSRPWRASHQRHR